MFEIALSNFKQFFKLLALVHTLFSIRIEPTAAATASGASGGARTSWLGVALLVNFHISLTTSPRLTSLKMPFQNDTF